MEAFHFNARSHSATPNEKMPSSSSSSSSSAAAAAPLLEAFPWTIPTSELPSLQTLSSFPPSTPPSPFSKRRPSIPSSSASSSSPSSSPVVGSSSSAPSHSSPFLKFDSPPRPFFAPTTFKLDNFLSPRYQFDESDESKQIIIQGVPLSSLSLEEETPKVDFEQIFKSINPSSSDTKPHQQQQRTKPNDEAFPSLQQLHALQSKRVQLFHQHEKEKAAQVVAPSPPPPPPPAAAVSVPGTIEPFCPSIFGELVPENQLSNLTLLRNSLRSGSAEGEAVLSSLFNSRDCLPLLFIDLALKSPPLLAECVQILLTVAEYSITSQETLLLRSTSPLLTEKLIPFFFILLEPSSSPASAPTDLQLDILHCLTNIAFKNEEIRSKLIESFDIELVISNLILLFSGTNDISSLQKVSACMHTLLEQPNGVDISSWYPIVEVLLTLNNDTISIEMISLFHKWTCLTVGSFVVPHEMLVRIFDIFRAAVAAKQRNSPLIYLILRLFSSTALSIAFVADSEEHAKRASFFETLCPFLESMQSLPAAADDEVQFILSMFTGRAANRQQRTLDAILSLMPRAVSILSAPCSPLVQEDIISSLPLIISKIATLYLPEIVSSKLPFILAKKLDSSSDIQCNCILKIILSVLPPKMDQKPAVATVADITNDVSPLVLAHLLRTNSPDNAVECLNIVIRFVKLFNCNLEEIFNSVGLNFCGRLAQQFELIRSVASNSFVPFDAVSYKLLFQACAVFSTTLLPHVHDNNDEHGDSSGPSSPSPLKQTALRFLPIICEVLEFAELKEKYRLLAPLFSAVLTPEASTPLLQYIYESGLYHAIISFIPERSALFKSFTPIMGRFAEAVPNSEPDLLDVDTLNDIYTRMVDSERTFPFVLYEIISAYMKCGGTQNVQTIVHCKFVSAAVSLIESGTRLEAVFLLYAILRMGTKHQAAYLVQQNAIKTVCYLFSRFQNGVPSPLPLVASQRIWNWATNFIIWILRTFRPTAAEGKKPWDICVGQIIECEGTDIHRYLLRCGGRWDEAEFEQAMAARWQRFEKAQAKFEPSS